MAYQIRVAQRAENELDDVMGWYEQEKSGLGIAFLNHFFNRVAYLKNNPYLYQEVYKTYRRLLMQKYPYAVYYGIEEQKQEVTVLAIWHTSKNPERLRQVKVTCSQLVVTSATTHTASLISLRVPRAALP